MSTLKQRALDASGKRSKGLSEQKLLALRSFLIGFDWLNYKGDVSKLTRPEVEIDGLRFTVSLGGFDHTATLMLITRKPPKFFRGTRADAQSGYVPSEIAIRSLADLGDALTEYGQFL